MKQAPNTGKCTHAASDWFWFRFSLSEKVGQVRTANHRLEWSKNKANTITCTKLLYINDDDNDSLTGSQCHRVPIAASGALWYTHTSKFNVIMLNENLLIGW